MENRKFREPDYYFTQTVIGCGDFGTYLKEFKLKESIINYKYFGEEGTKDQIFFLCPRWQLD